MCAIDMVGRVPTVRWDARSTADALAQQGLDLEGFSVDVGGQSTFAESREEFGHQISSDARAQGDEVAEIVPASSTVRMPDSGDVDFTA